MTSAVISALDIAARYHTVYEETMRELPICNSALEVEVVGPSTLDNHQLGVLISPWFMNLILLPGDDSWADDIAGTICTLPLPSAPCEFTVCQDEVLGTFLSAVLFHSVNDFPDQETAVAVARESLVQLLQQPSESMRQRQRNNISRRTLLSGLSTR